jgi:hypothetical protein
VLRLSVLVGGSASFRKHADQLVLHDLSECLQQLVRRSLSPRVEQKVREGVTAEIARHRRLYAECLGALACGSWRQIDYLERLLVR